MQQRGKQTKDVKLQSLVRCQGRVRQEQGGPYTSPHCPEPSLGHNHCDSALAKMHRLVEVTVSAYFDINVNVSPTVSQPVCVCVCVPSRLLPCLGHPWRSPWGQAGAAKPPTAGPPQLWELCSPDPCSSFNSCFSPPHLGLFLSVFPPFPVQIWVLHPNL